MALLGLVTVMLWAGLLTLLLFWREDTPSPMRPLSCALSQNPTFRCWDVTPLRVQFPHRASHLVPSGPLPRPSARPPPESSPPRPASLSPILSVPPEWHIPKASLPS